MLRTRLIAAALLLNIFFPLASCGGGGGSSSPPPGIAFGLEARPAAVAYLNMPLTEAGTIPALLSQTGVFFDEGGSIPNMIPGSSLIPYSMNSPLWSDGASKSRWISVPTGQKVVFTTTGEWTFPVGTVFVKHFEMATDEGDPGVIRRLETRLLVAKADGTYYGVTYKWKSDNSDADLLAVDLTETIAIEQVGSGSWTKSYTYPVTSCNTCHNSNANFILGVMTPQMNGMFNYPSTGVTDNQLRTWSHIGMFDVTLDESVIPTYDKLVPVTATGAGLEERVRSYLHANCALCHRAGGSVPTTWDVRSHMFTETSLTGATLANNFLGLDNPEEVGEKDLGRSYMFLRIARTSAEGFQMPSVGRNHVDFDAVGTFQEWIDSLAGTPVLIPPAISPDGGTHNPATVTVSIQHPNPVAAIYYTTDGSDPDATDNFYTTSFSLDVTGGIEIRAAALGTGFVTSAVASKTFDFNPGIGTMASTPIFSTNGGTFTGSVVISIVSGTSGSTIRYTLNGATPDSSSREYDGPITISRFTHLKAVAIKAGLADSPVASAIFLVNP